MRILLDTHAFLWLASDRRRVRKEALKVLEDGSNEVFYSAAVSWEITVKRTLGKLEFSGSPSARARVIGLTELAMTAEHGETAGNLPLHHGDPFDRMLIAQAQVEGLVLATRDAMLSRYGVRLLPV